MSQSEFKKSDLKTDLQMLINQVVASNLTITYYLHLKDGVSKEECATDIWSTWIGMQELADKLVGYKNIKGKK